MGVWGIAPSDFWRMTLREFWCVYDAKVGEPKYGNLSESEVDSCYQTLMAAKDGKTSR